MERIGGAEPHQGGHVSDERDQAVRLEEHQEHAAWVAQHAAWGADAREWLGDLDGMALDLGELGALLDRERGRVVTYLAALRRHEAQIARHDLELRAADQGPCAGCDPVGAPSHAAGRAEHQAEQTTHAWLDVRQRRIRALLRELEDLLDLP